MVKQMLPKPWTYARVEAAVQPVGLLDAIHPDCLVKLLFIFPTNNLCALEIKCNERCKLDYTENPGILC